MKFKSLLIFLILLIVFGGNAHATKPRKFGVGLRYGYINDETFFQGTADGDKNTYINASIGAGINSVSIIKFPLFIQFDEELLDSFLTSSFFLEIQRLEQTDHPPNLKNTTFDKLIDSNIKEVPSDNTYTNEFSEIYPQYSSLIEKANNPSLSADYEITAITFGRNISIFYPYSENSRWTTFGAGLGLYLLSGNYSINICDPYTISTEIGNNGLVPSFRKAVCQNKNLIYNSEIGRFYYSAKISVTIYSYIGDEYEINILSGELTVLGADENYTNYTKDALKPIFRYQNSDLVSVVYTF